MLSWRWGELRKVMMFGALPAVGVQLGQGFTDLRSSKTGMIANAMQAAPYHRLLHLEFVGGA
jgi:hypothetical protein